MTRKRLWGIDEGDGVIYAAYKTEEEARQVADVEVAELIPNFTWEQSDWTDENGVNWITVERLGAAFRDVCQRSGQQMQVLAKLCRIKPETLSRYFSGRLIVPEKLWHKLNVPQSDILTMIERQKAYSQLRAEIARRVTPARKEAGIRVAAIMREAKAKMNIDWSAQNKKSAMKIPAEKRVAIARARVQKRWDRWRTEGGVQISNDEFREMSNGIPLGEIAKGLGVKYERIQSWRRNVNPASIPASMSDQIRAFFAERKKIDMQTDEHTDSLF